MKTPDYNLKELPGYDDPVEAKAHRQSCAYPPATPPPAATNSKTKSGFGWIGWVCGFLVAAAILVGAIGLARHHYNNPAQQPLAYQKAMNAGGRLNGAKAAFGNASAVFNRAAGKMVAVPQTVVRKIVRKVKGRPENFVYFFAKSNNSVPENATLNKLADEASKNGASITVTGYADPSGSADFNRRLSERRAKSVGDYLVSHGVPAENVSASGAGVTTDYGDAPHNRRAEIHVDY